MDKEAASDRQELRAQLTRRIVAGGVACLLAVAAGGVALSGISETAARSSVRDALNDIRATMQTVMGQNIQVIRGMMGYVRANPDLTQQDFELIAQDVLEGATGHVRNLALARDLVISHMYPLEGNAAAVGLNYREEPDQWEAVRRVIEGRRLVVAGPLTLKQGGVGLIARFPIFLRPDRDGNRRLWGIASTVIDFDSFITSTGLDDLLEDYEIALVGRDGDVTNREVVWGDESVAAREPVVLHVVLGSAGAWELLALPRAGWLPLSRFWPWLLAGGTILFLVFSIWSISSYRVAVARRDASRRIINALERARSASAAKSNFMAMMSHELRTPLTAIIGFSEALESQPRDGPIWRRAEEYITDIRRSGQFLLAIINDILDLSRIESGRHDFTLEPLDLNEQAADAYRKFEDELRSRGMTPELRLAGSAVIGYGDRRAVQQILNNLLSNALKYAGSGASVIVETSVAADGRARIAIADDGIGIPSAKVADVMEPFVQVATGYTSNQGGTGLGFAICRSLARGIGGWFSVTSDTGKGVAAVLHLPTQPVAAGTLEALGPPRDEADVAGPGNAAAA